MASAAAPAAAKVTTHTVAHSTAAHVAAPVAVTETAAAAAPPPAPAPATTSGSAVQPVVDMNAKTLKSTTASATPKRHDDTVPIAAGGALALLAIGGAAIAMNRRRHEDEEWIDEAPVADEPMAMAEADEVSHEPVVHEEQPAIVAPPVSAFGWGNGEQSAQTATEEPMVEQDDRNPGETWIERAYRGPSPLNPSVSLKTRLRRAAFFDKRERQAAAGLAEPVDPSAGLPDRMVEARETELA